MNDQTNAGGKKEAFELYEAVAELPLTLLPPLMCVCVFVSCPFVMYFQFLHERIKIKI